MQYRQNESDFKVQEEIKTAVGQRFSTLKSLLVQSKQSDSDISDLFQGFQASTDKLELEISMGSLKVNDKRPNLILITNQLSNELEKEEQTLKGNILYHRRTGR
jgi:hypothetical protein